MVLLNTSSPIPISCSVSPFSGKSTVLFALLMVESEPDDGDFFESLKSKVNFGKSSLRLVIKTMYSMVTTPSSFVSFSDKTKLTS